MNLYTRRYRTYAKKHGVNDPGEMLARDREAWPGGCMIGFTQWIRAMKSRFVAENKDICCVRCAILCNQERFDDWLETA